MSIEDLYDDADRERVVAEPPKRVDAPVRLAFERDRARVVHAAASRRLAAKTQVVGPQTDDFVRNRLTHSLEVAQVARDLARALGTHPDIAETAALAHDLGHPPFGHNGERVLAELSTCCGGFEGNAQTLRLLTRLESKTFDADGRSAGLNLTRATLDACTKYPWPRSAATGPHGVHADGTPRVVVKFGVYDDDRPVFDWLRAGVEGRRRCLEAQVMDLADDVAYSVHDVEDGIVAGPARPHPPRPGRPVGDGALVVPARAPTTPRSTGPSPTCVPSAAGRGRRTTAAGAASPRSRTSRATSSAASAAASRRPPSPPRRGSRSVRHRADLVVPAHTEVEIGVLKGIAALYVMQADDRVSLMQQQRELVAELVEALWERGADALDPVFAGGLGATPTTTRLVAASSSTRSRRSPTPAPSRGTPR